MIIKKLQIYKFLKILMFQKFTLNVFNVEMTKFHFIIYRILINQSNIINLVKNSKNISDQSSSITDDVHRL